MRIVFIIGNGFNFLIESIIQNIPDTNLPTSLTSNKLDICNRINEISMLWKKFDALLGNLKHNYPQIGEEELIRMIYTVLDFFSNLDEFENILSKKVIDEIKNKFDFLLIDQIRLIAEEFRAHENSEGYKDLKRIFPNFGSEFKDLIDNNNIARCDFFTTNYDGILDTLLTLNNSGFLAADGFGKIPELPGYYKLYDDNLNKTPTRCFHLHGSYRFEKKHGNTYKNSKDTYNPDPVIVFNNPRQKEELIERDPVLRTYLSEFQSSIEKADKLIIIGNSMKAEPHLKKIIKRKFNKDGKVIYLCSRNPSEIQKEITDSFSYEMILRRTSKVKYPQDLINFFDELIKHNS